MRGDVVLHGAVVIRLVGGEVEVPRARQPEQDDLFLPLPLAAERFVHGGADGVRALGRGQDALALGELHRRLEHLVLLDGDRAQIPVVIELRENGAHAVIAQPARVARGGHEAAAERIHFGERRDLRRIAEIVHKLPARHGGAARRLDADKLNVVLALQLLPHEGRDEPAEVGAAAHAADDDIGGDAVLFERRLALEPDDRLMQQNVVEHGTQNIAAAGRGCRALHRLGDGAAQRPARSRELLQDLSARLRRIGGRRDDVRAIGADDLFAVGFLLGGHLHHIHVEVQPVECRRHRKRRAPLPRARLGGDGREPLLFGIVRLRRRGIELVRAGRVVPLKFIVDLRGRVEQPFEVVGAHERRRTEHPVKVENALRNGDALVLFVELLFDAFLAENRAQLGHGTGLLRRGVQKRRMLRLHVRLHVIPCARHFLLGEIDLVGNVLGCHAVPPFASAPDAAVREADTFDINLNKKTRSDIRHGTNRSVLPPNFTARRLPPSEHHHALFL